MVAVVPTALRGTTRSVEDKFGSILYKSCSMRGTDAWATCTTVKATPKSTALLLLTVCSWNQESSAQRQLESPTRGARVEWTIHRKEKRCETVSISKRLCINRNFLPDIQPGVGSLVPS